MSERWSSAKVLKERGLAPKRSFGQNFLQDASISEQIAVLSTTPRGGTVLELGAGAGALTAPLSERASLVFAVERDRDLVPVLGELFASASHVRIVEADAARVDWLELLREGPPPRVIAGNLPYQITGRLIELAVRCAPHVERAVFMVQREVACRLAAKPGDADYGASSVFAQAAFEVERALKVPAGCFYPAPNVDSAVIVLTPHRPPRARETKAFRELVKRAFGQRRKTLKNAWKGVFGWSSDNLDFEASEVGIELSQRGEGLSVEEFAALAERAPPSFQSFD